MNPLYKIFSYMVESTSKLDLTKTTNAATTAHFYYTDSHQGNMLFILNKSNHNLVATLSVEGVERDFNIDSKYSILSFGTNIVKLVNVDVVRINSGTIRQYNSDEPNLCITRKKISCPPICQNIVDQYFSNDHLSDRPDYRYMFEIGIIESDYTVTFSGENTIISINDNQIVKFLRGRIHGTTLYTNSLDVKDRIKKLQDHFSVSESRKILYDESIKKSKDKISKLLESTNDLSMLHDTIRALNGNPYEYE